MARSATHRVAAGENLYRIGRLYGVDARSIAEANGIRDVHGLRVGQELIIPRPSQVPTRRTGAWDPADEAARRRARETAEQQGSLKFVWPARGRLSSGFGMRKGRPHEGIDIAARRGSMIRAAEAGRVIHSGRMRGYGLVVILKHEGAYRSVYAHASRLLVRKGQFVKKGQKIAEVGSTGRSSGPHLHFEIRKQETPQNPIAFLPRVRAR